MTLAMAMALVDRGYRVRDFLHLAFPLEEHDERAWGKRLHLPLQLALGRPGLVQRRRLVWLSRTHGRRFFLSSGGGDHAVPRRVNRGSTAGSSHSAEPA